MAHPGEDAGQMHVLELRRPLPGELSIEMLTRAAERLAFFGRFDAQPLGMFAADPLKEPLVKIVAIACREPFE